MGAFVRCLRCDKQFRPTSWRRERLCSTRCLRELRAALRRGRVCQACGNALDPWTRADTRFCSARCRQRVARYLAAESYREFIRDLVAEDLREHREAWRHMRRSNPEGYAKSRQAKQLRTEEHRMMATYRKRDFRVCENCERPVAMRGGQRYCSTRCRVAAHRRRAAAR